MNRTLKILLIVGGVAATAVGAVFTIKKVGSMMEEQAVADSNRPNVSFSRPTPKIVKQKKPRPIPIHIEVSEDDE